MKSTSDTATEIAMDRFHETSSSRISPATAFGFRMYWIGAARGAVSAEYSNHKLEFDAYQLMLETLKAWEDLALNEYLNRQEQGV